MNIIPILCLVVLAAAVVFIITPPRPPWPSQSTQTVTGKVRYVVDGDSLYLASHSPQIRLWGVNAPERHQNGFHASAQFLRRVAYGKRLTCEVIDTDKYGRTVARCYLPDGRDLGRVMLEAGYVQEMRGFSRGYYSRRS